MFKSILGSIFALAVFAPPSMAAPSIAVQVVDTPYGTFSCAQRGSNKLYSMGATSVDIRGGAIWGNIFNNRVLIWCRGDSVFITVAGDNPSDIRDEITKAF
jgi:hypothetical protein